MRVLYVTRNINRSGYMCLEALIGSGKDVIGVVVTDEKNRLSNRFTRPFSILCYRISCKYYGAKLDKWLDSEEILAKRNKIPVHKINDIRSADFVRACRALNPSIIVVGGGWHQRLPAEILAIPQYGCINVHPSLLPKYRGTSVHIWQILRGESQSGVTIHYMDEHFDTGDIIAQQDVELSINDKPYQLAHKVALVSGPLLVKTLEQIETDTVVRKHQNAEGVEYFHKWLWPHENLSIDWSQSSFEIHNLIRACSQYDYRLLGAFTYFRGSILRIWEAELLASCDKTDERPSPGSILGIIEGQGLLVATGDGAILTKRVQDNKWWSRSTRADRYCHKRDVSIGERFA